MERLLAPPVSALLAALLAPADLTPLEPRLTREMITKVRNMPRYMAPGVVGLTLALEHSTRARFGRPFSALSPAERARVVQGWRSSRISLRRDLVEVYEKMGTFLFYALIEEGAA